MVTMPDDVIKTFENPECDKQKVLIKKNDDKQDDYREGQRNPDLEGRDGQNISKKVAHQAHVKTPGHTYQDYPQCHADAAEDADGRIFIDPRFLPQLDDSYSGDDSCSQGRTYGPDMEEQAQRYSAESQMGQPVADHGIPPQDKKDSQHGTDRRNQKPHQKGPLHKAVRKNCCQEMLPLLYPLNLSL